MKEINLNKNLKKQFEEKGLSYPYLKYNKKYGLKGSSLNENKNLTLCLLNHLKYLYENNLINFDEKRYFEILENGEVLK